MLRLKAINSFPSSGGGGGDITVINNLTSTSTTNALSANMGRVLNEKIAGNVPAIVASDYSALTTYLNSAEKTSLGVGENVYIKKMNVPDLWISEVKDTAVTCTYTTDEQFITDLEAGTLQIGYALLSQLETQKVDLTNYITNTDYASSSSAGIIRASSSYGTQVSGGFLQGRTRTYAEYSTDSGVLFVCKGTLENVIAGKNIISTVTLTQAEFDALTTYDDNTNYQII